tara:strand:- start:1975 stop:2133 length:159 start_codon:yes stop_codon:yes gene_type:complete
MAECITKFKYNRDYALKMDEHFQRKEVKKCERKSKCKKSIKKSQGGVHHVQA